ncbi:LysM peptidoglycan-binding domain-containing protein [Paludibacterium paludis]|uniref:Uncharacterized protein n=1 Tax=Paludibacterium paludis TaxID=1225769 RepID=A0A918NYH7_9NEIS|nr:hypothetical protein [Paludibacterium paludis]GGY07082.1 hypothetical protein GCM10011289_07110 [Paludibacterium paludis]
MAFSVSSLGEGVAGLTRKLESFAGEHDEQEGVAADGDVLGATRLRLGDIEFTGLELPEQIGIHLQQRLVSHDLVGGARIVDTLGAFYEPVEWSGTLDGPGAVARDEALRALAADAGTHMLNWDVYSFRVVVAGYTSKYLNHAHIDYTIRCMVLEVPTASAEETAPDVADQVNEAVDNAGAQAEELGDPRIMEAVTAVKDAINTVHDVATAAVTQVQGVVSKLVSAQQAVAQKIAVIEEGVSKVVTLGGLAPGNPVARAAQDMMGRVDAWVKLPALYRLQDSLGDARKALETLPAFAASVEAAGKTVSKAEGRLENGVRSVVRAAGDLYDIAARELGNVAHWPVIAEANHLDDPVLPEGINVIRIPPRPSANALIPDNPAYRLPS